MASTGDAEVDRRKVYSEIMVVVFCGPRLTTLITSTSQLYSFGDEIFGVLGHGDRNNIGRI